MNFNVDAFKALRDGHGLQSPAIGKTTAMNGELSAADTALQGLKATGFDPARINQMETVLATGSDVGGSVSSHVSQQLQDMTGTMGMSGAVKDIQAVADAVPPSCLDMNAILGSVTGAMDNDLDAVAAKSGDLVTGIADFIAGTLDAAGLTALFDQVESAISAGIASLKSKMDSENSLIGELRAVHRQFADACALDRLVNDPCARALIDKTASPELKTALKLVS